MKRIENRTHSVCAAMDYVSKTDFFFSGPLHFQLSRFYSFFLLIVLNYMFSNYDKD